MRRFLLCCILAVMAMTVSGCVTGSGNYGWITDSDQYCKLSGFSIQPPAGSNWFRAPKDDRFPNGILFQKVEPTAIRFNPYHPEFTITVVTAYGAPINPSIFRDTEDQVLHDGLRRLLEQRQKKAGVVVEDTAFDNSLGAECITFRGKPVKTDVNSQYGVIRYSSVDGYLCLHPQYRDFVVGMESKNGASVEIMPADRKDQTDHFFKSIFFTPRDLPAKSGSPSKDEGKQVKG